MPPPPFSIVCLCAEWCGTCREYRDGFEGLRSRFPDTRFIWLDIEEHADALGDLDIENFPTLLVNRGDAILYFGVMLPYPEHLARILESFREQDAQQSADYANAAERRRWQTDPDLRGLLNHCRDR